MTEKASRSFTISPSESSANLGSRNTKLVSQFSPKPATLKLAEACSVYCTIKPPAIKGMKNLATGIANRRINEIENVRIVNNTASTPFQCTDKDEAMLINIAVPYIERLLKANTGVQQKAC